MARQPRQQMMLPEYLTVYNLGGGLRTDMPPDQIDNGESPDLINMVWNNRTLASDTGYRAIGNPTYGVPLKTFTYVDNGGVRRNVLVTTKTFYVWNSSLGDWVPPAIRNTSLTSVSLATTGTGVPASFPVGVAGFVTVGTVVSIPMDNGFYLTGTVQSVIAGIVTLDTILPVGRILPLNSPVVPCFTSANNGKYPPSFAFDPVADWLVVNTGADIPQQFDGTLIKDLTGLSAIVLTQAAWVTRFHSVTVFLNTVENGVAYPYRVRRSATGDSTNWTTLDSGFDDLDDTDDPLRVGLIVGSYLIIFRDENIIRASYWGSGLQVFYYENAVSTVGLLGFSSASISFQGAFLASDQGMFVYAGDYTVRDIGTKIFPSILGANGDIDPDALGGDFTLYEEIYDSFLFFYQSVGQTSANKMQRLSSKKGSWFPRLFADEIVGAGPFMADNAQTWDQLVGTWDQQTWTWNARSQARNFSTIALCGSANNQVFLYDYQSPDDNGKPINWSFTTKDFMIPENWETVDGFVIYGRAGSILVEMSTNSGDSWTSLGTIVLPNNWTRDEVDTSVASHNFRFRLSGTGAGTEISWFALKHYVASES